MKYKIENRQIKMQIKENVFLLYLGVRRSTSRQAGYTQLIKIIEYICELFYLALLKISIPTIMLCALIVTLINFFILDLGDDAYYLPFPTMYVKRGEIERALTAYLKIYFLDCHST